VHPACVYEQMEKRKIIVGISGASGTVYGMRLLEVLHGYSQIETHLVISANIVDPKNETVC